MGSKDLEMSGLKAFYTGASGCNASHHTKIQDEICFIAKDVTTWLCCKVKQDTRKDTIVKITFCPSKGRISIHDKPGKQQRQLKGTNICRGLSFLQRKFPISGVYVPYFGKHRAHSAYHGVTDVSTANGIWTTLNWVHNMTCSMCRNKLCADMFVFCWKFEKVIRPPHSTLLVPLFYAKGHW